MFNPDLKEMLKNVNSRYSLVVGTAKRAREIQDEAIANEDAFGHQDRMPWLLTTSIPVSM